MNEAEKRVLRRKKHVIASTIEWDEDFIKLLLDNNLLTDEMNEDIQGEGTNFAQVSKFIQLLCNNAGSKKTFMHFCDVLEPKYESLSDSIKAELRAETGQLTIEDYIEKEAAILVYREFGSSKRLSEKEKVEIKDLVAKTTQCEKEKWMRQLEAAKKYLIAETERNKEKDEYSKRLIVKVNDFLQVHRERLRKIPKYATEKSTTELFEERERAVKNLDRPLVNILEDVMSDLRHLTDQCLTEKDHLQDDKTKALKVLDVNDPNAKLDVELKKKLDQAAKELIAQQDDIKQREAKAEELRKNIAKLKADNEVALNEKDKEIEDRTKYLNQCHSKIRDVKDEIEQLKRELRYTREELLKYKKKSEVLEKTRRLGYLEKKGENENNKGKKGGKK